MIEVSPSQFDQNPIHYQTLAQIKPTLASNGRDSGLLDYTQKPFVSLYEAFANVPTDLREALAKIDDDEPDDFSYIQHPNKAQIS